MDRKSRRRTRRKSRRFGGKWGIFESKRGRGRGRGNNESIIGKLVKTLPVSEIINSPFIKNMSNEQIKNYLLPFIPQNVRPVFNELISRIPHSYSQSLSPVPEETTEEESEN